MSNNLPIGVFDSGVGGVSVLSQLMNIMPNENYIYFGDKKNAPYGSKSHEKIRELTLACVVQLMDIGIKALVVACNTATSVAIDELRQIYPSTPVIGVEPAIKPAALNTRGGTVLVMATPATLGEHRVEQLMDTYGDICRFELLPCHRLARLVEDGHYNDAVLDSYLEEILTPFKGRVNSVVLGCTHYPFAKNAIITHLGSNVRVFDGALGTANEAHRRLADADLLTQSTCPGSLQVLASDAKDSFKDKVLMLLDAI